MNGNGKVEGNLYPVTAIYGDPKILTVSGRMGGGISLYTHIDFPRSTGFSTITTPTFYAVFFLTQNPQCDCQTHT